MNSLTNLASLKLFCLVSEHQDEPTSYYCLQQQCKAESRLICVLCSYNSTHKPHNIHQSHEIKPLKLFLQTISKDLNAMNNSIHLIAKIDQLKSTLYEQCFTNINQQDLNKMLLLALKGYFISIEEQCQFQIVQRINKCIEEGDDANFGSLLEKYIQKWRKYYDEDKKNQSIYQAMIFSIINDLQQKNATINQAIKKKQIDISLVQMFKNQSASSKKFYFSSKMMNAGLTFVDKTKIKISGYADYNYLALCEPAISSHKIQKVTFKMTALSSYITLGICIKSKIQGQYQFMSGSIGHGTYQISYDGYSWSDHDSAVNQQYSSWYYNQGDTVTVEVNPKTKMIKFIKNNDETNAKQMGYDLSNKSDKIHFCISLNSDPEEVDIVD